MLFVLLLVFLVFWGEGQGVGVGVVVFWGAGIQRNVTLTQSIALWSAIIGREILYPFFEMNEDQDHLTYYNLVTMRTENSVDPDQLASLHHLIEWKSKVYTT